jgi:uncharacterized protein YndB with AHSA1/START domain
MARRQVRTGLTARRRRAYALNIRNEKVAFLGRISIMQPKSCIMNTNSIEKRVEIKAPVSRVWRALTDHAEFGQWFGAKLDGPFVPGKTTAGRITHKGYEHIRWAATVQRMETGRYFSFTWHPYAIDNAADYSKEPPTLVEFRLAKSKGGTLLTVTESGFDKIPASRRAEAFRKHDEGWAGQMESIKAHVT